MDEKRPRAALHEDVQQPIRGDEAIGAGEMSPFRAYGFASGLAAVIL